MRALPGSKDPARFRFYWKISLERIQDLFAELGEVRIAMAPNKGHYGCGAEGNKTRGKMENPKAFL